MANTLLKVVFLITLCLPVSVFSQTQLGSNGARYHPIGVGVKYIEDQAHTLTIDSVLNSHQVWQTSNARVFNQGYSSSAWWLKLELINVDDPDDFIAEIAYAVIDHLDMYIRNEQGKVIHHQTGDKFNFSQRPIEHRLFLVPFELPKGQSLEMILRVESTSSIQVPLTIWEKDTYISVDVGISILHGLYMGAILCIAIYNLLIYIALRESTYLYYVCYVVSMALFIASLNGWSFQYLWPTSTIWNDKSILFSLNGVLIFGVIFIKRFLSLGSFSRKLSITADSLALISGLGFIVLLALPYSLSIKIIIPYAAIVCCWGLYAGIYSWLKGQPSSGLFVIAWGGIFIGGIILALNKLQILPANIFTDYATQMASLAEVLLLSFALADRINLEKAMRLEAQAEALDAQRKANEELEKRVAERTKDLEAANKKLKELSDTDQLTGLKNRRYLDQMIEREITRAKRFQHDMAVLLMDIDHFKSVNDNFGHLVGDICLQEVAKRIAKQLRGDTDLCARYGGEEFCVILPETPQNGAMVVAERIRTSVNQSRIIAENFDQHISVSIGVFSSVPVDNEDAEFYLAKADAALYKAKEEGRNRVEFYSLSA